MESLGVPLLHPMNVNLEQELDRRFRFWDCPPGGSAESLRVYASAICAWSATPDTVPSLENVTSFSVGINCVDLPKCCERRIRVTNTPDMLTDDIADLIVCLTISALRKTPQADRYVCRLVERPRGATHSPGLLWCCRGVQWQGCQIPNS